MTLAQFECEPTNFNAVARELDWNGTIKLGSNEPKEAFVSMCNSDLLITGASGFSFLVAKLCRRPLVLAVPMWLSYECIENAYMLEVAQNKSYMGHSLVSRFAIPSNLEELLRSRIEGYIKLW